jgi:release factor glutamine methyltransferase
VHHLEPGPRRLGERQADAAADVRDHEPRVALDGGPDGLAFYRRIAAGVVPFLKPGGRLLMEIGFTQDEFVRAILAAQPGLEVGPTLKDMSGHPRVVVAKKVTSAGSTSPAA